MDPIKLIKDFDRYLNIELPKVWGYDEKYKVSIDTEGNKTEILLTAKNDVSTISANWISGDRDENSSQDISNFEQRITEYLETNVKRIDQRSITFDYDYNVIIVKFKVL